MSDETQRREAIDSVAADYRRTVERAGWSITHEQARERVTDAIRKGDAKRENGNK